MEASSINIILDSTEIREHRWRLDDPLSTLLAEGAHALRHRVYIPEVVVHEVLNGYRENLEKERSTVTRRCHASDASRTASSNHRWKTGRWSRTSRISTSTSTGD